MNSLLAGRGHRLCPVSSCRGRVLCITALALLLVAVGPSAAARAYVPEPVVQQNIPTIAEHLARGGATSIPGVNCGTTCTDLWLQEHRPIPNQPSSAQLHRELTDIRSRGVKVLPALRVLGTVGLAVETFRIGIKIGQGLNEKLFGFGVPDAPAEVTSARVRYASAGQIIRDWLPPMPYDGWYLEYNTGRFVYAHIQRKLTSEGDTGSSRQCVLGPQVMSEGLEALPNGVVEPCYRGTFMSEAWIMPETGTMLNGQSPVEDYVGQPYERTITTWPDQPTDRTALETRTRNALESGEYPLVEAWSAELLDPRNHDTANDEDEACALGDGGTGVDPGLGRGSGDTGEEFLRRYEQVPADVYPTAGLPSVNGTVHMRWGVTTPNVDNTHIEWRGWGYRKIKAKHGWGPDDLEATRLALLDAIPVPDPTTTGRYTYAGPEYPGRNGTRCKRVVVVEHERNQEEIQKAAPASAGIITSFGQRIG